MKSTNDAAKGPSWASAVNRRDFATLTGIAMLGGVVPEIRELIPIGAGPIMSAVTYGVTLVGDRTETLVGGAVRRTIELDLQGLPSDRGTTHVTVVQTKARTATGDVIDYAVPRLLRGTTSRNGIDALNELHLRCEFAHGTVLGDVRQDTLTLTARVAGTAVGPIVRRVLRPLLAADLGATTPSRRVARALELIGQNGGTMPPRYPGTVRVMD